MARRLVRMATRAAERLADQGVALENARDAATALARGRVDRLEVEHYLERQARDRAAGPGRSRMPHSVNAR